MKKLYSQIFVLTIVLAVAAVAGAENAPTPAKLEGVEIVIADEVEGLAGQKDVYVFDTRNESNYGKGHLRGAASLPGKLDPAALPADRDAKIVFLSDGPDEWNSYHAAKKAREAGYKNVMWYRQGFADWSKKGYSLEH
ncbi:MAG: rhodanese-like domain-containing protein [Nitrospirae bacterium]|nr:rhodanese-like domain-containing protein [Nitrospirota bacterium]